MTTQLFLVRHGETAWNAEARLQGQLDVPLSALGRQQAELLRARLEEERLDAACSSDLERCWETAVIALRGRDIHPTPDIGLREIDFGDWQGLTFADVEQRRPDDFRLWRDDPVDAAPHGGESRRQLQSRIAATLTAIVARYEGQRVLVVTHGGALRAALCWLLDADLRSSWRIEVDNCGLSRVDFRPDRPVVAHWNEVAHLRGLLHERVGQQVSE